MCSPTKGTKDAKKKERTRRESDHGSLSFPRHLDFFVPFVGNPAHNPAS
jgi:hypothetical protein